MTETYQAADWDRYGMTEVVHRPRKMEPAALSQTMRECCRRLYDLSVLEGKAEMTYRETGDRVAAAMAWQSNLNYRNVVLSEGTYP